MANADDIIDLFCDRVRTAIRSRADFPAFLFEPFTPQITQMLIEQLPALSAYSPMPHPDSRVDGQPTRFALPLNTATPYRVWAELSRILRSEQIRQAVADVLELPAAAMQPYAALIRDLPGYRIGIHPDSAHKIATVQVYLARHYGSPHIGVRFHTEADDRFIETGSVAYHPGQGYFFRRTETSWHSVNATGPGDGVRDSLMLIYFDSPKNGFS